MASKTQQHIYRTLLNGYAGIVGAKHAKEIDAKLRYHRKLNLEHPKTLSDKISWIELNTDQTLAACCTDKWEVRNYIAERGLEELLIPAFGPWNKAEDIDLNTLPNAFALKATHGCEMNYIVPDKSKLNFDDMLRHARSWLSHDYARACVEPHYKLIPHRVYAEEFIGGMDKIVDYKFHCLNGEPRFVLTCSERDKGLKLNLYDLNWNPIPGIQGPMKNNKEISRPSQLGQMVKVAKTLCADFDFVRVDLYEINGLVRFGELTFSPAGGVLNYYNDDFNLSWGKALHISTFNA
jgi:hypothetical protein